MIIQHNTEHKKLEDDNAFLALFTSVSEHMQSDKKSKKKIFRKLTYHHQKQKNFQSLLKENVVCVQFLTKCYQICLFTIKKNAPVH